MRFSGAVVTLRALDQAHFTFEVVNVREALVDRRKTQRSHGISRSKAVEHGEANPFRAQLWTDQPGFFFDLRSNGLKVAVGEGATLGRCPEATSDVGAIERNPGSVTFHDNQRELFHSLERGETSAACTALAAPPSGRSIVG